MIKLKDSKESSIFISSDLHLNHLNICKGTSKWPDSHSVRDFETPDQMNNNIIDNINKVVRDCDVLILLGDLLFRWKSPEDYRAAIEDKINSNHIIYINGNHDHPDRMKIGLKDSHHIIYMGDTLLFQIDDRLVFLSHYSHRVWPESHHGAFHLYGHSHGTVEDFGKSMDVGIDAAFNEYGEYKPYKWSDIKSKLDKKQIESVDYHNSRTT